MKPCAGEWTDKAVCTRHSYRLLAVYIVYSLYIRYIGHIYGQILAIYFFFWAVFGPILAIFGHGRPYFFIDARDGMAGGRVGRQVSHASMKKNKK